MARAMQAVHALHHQAVSADAIDLRTHLHQQVGQVGHLGLARGVLQHGLALGQRGGHQQILGAGHGDHVRHHARALQTAGAGVDEAVLDGDLGAHRLQALDVLVHRPRADAAAARQGDAGLAEARHQRPQHEDRRAHGLHQLVRGLGRIDVGGGQRGRGAVNVGPGAHLAQQLEHRARVLQVRHVVDGDGIGGQQAGAQDRQRRILGARNPDLALERAVALDLEFVHVVSVFVMQR
ncbi:hypothetical protein D3C72_1665010 [compost metagenome]